jgi:hypothetical protein
MSLAWRLQRFLDKHGVTYSSSKRAFVTDCLSPSCGKEQHCYIWKNDGAAICFRCGGKWSWRRVVSIIANCHIQDSYSTFFGSGAGDSGVERLEVILDDPEEFSLEKGEPEISLGPDFVSVHLSPRGLSYLAKRNACDPEIIYSYDLRYHAMMDAVVFPIKKNSKIYGWQARRIEPKEGELRLISHMFSKSKFLLNWDFAKTSEKVVLVEGPFDCVSVDKRSHGFSGVASLGKGVSRDQIKLVVDLPAQDIYLGLDPDAAEEVYEVVKRIGLGKRIYRVLPPNGRKDFGECSHEETIEALYSSRPITGPSDFLEVYFK